LSAVFLATGFTLRDPVAIKRIPKVNDSTSLTMEVRMTMSDGQEGHITARMADSVTAVDQAAGTYTILETESDVTFNDAPVSSDSHTTQIQKFTGEVISITGDALGADPYRLQDLIQPYFPSAPLNVGDVFTQDIKSTNPGAVPIHVDGKLIALEKVGSFDTAKLEETVKETGKARGSAHSFIWVNIADGALVKQTADLTAVQLDSILITKGKMTLSRVKP
jgi:hypothetical protein